jgi:hypothetical protein
MSYAPANGATPTTDALAQVVEALNALYTNPDPAAKESADGWLKEFQKSVRFDSSFIEGGGEVQEDHVQR